MIEDHHAGSPRLSFDQLLDLRVVNRLQLRGIEEVRNLGLVFDENKALLVQRKMVGEQTAVTNRIPFQLVSADSSAANIVRAERLVHELLAGVHSVGNIDIRGSIIDNLLAVSQAILRQGLHGQ